MYIYIFATFMINCKKQTKQIKKLYQKKMLLLLPGFGEVLELDR